VAHADRQIDEPPCRGPEREEVGDEVGSFEGRGDVTDPSPLDDGRDRCGAVHEAIHDRRAGVGDRGGGSRSGDGVGIGLGGAECIDLLGVTVVGDVDRVGSLVDGDAVEGLAVGEIVEVGAGGGVIGKDLAGIGDVEGVGRRVDGDTPSCADVGVNARPRVRVRSECTVFSRWL